MQTATTDYERCYNTWFHVYKSTGICEHYKVTSLNHVVAALGQMVASMKKSKEFFSGHIGEM